MKVILTESAHRELEELGRVIHFRVLSVCWLALRKWPRVSGAKPLRHGLASRYRVRTGDYRVQFRAEGESIIVEKIGHRDGFYED